MARNTSRVGDEFEAARVIVETLKKLEKQQQERAMRFAGESLGLPGHTTIATPPVVHVPQHSSPSTAPAGRVVDIKQFTESKSPRSDQQFAAVVAYYYRFEAPPEQQKDTINMAVLADAARLAVRNRPGPLTLNSAKSQGYLDPAGRGEFRINTVGENLVAIALPSSSGNGGSSHPGSRSSRRIKRGPQARKERKTRR